MKKTKYEYVEVTEDVTMDELVNNFVQHEFNIKEWAEKEPWDREDFDANFDYFWEDYDISEDEKEEAFELIKKTCQKIVDKEKQNQIKRCWKDRDNIVYNIEQSSIYTDDECILSPEEIVDIIIKNGNK